MPYIKNKYRENYIPTIKNVLNIIPKEIDPFMQIEYAGYFFCSLIPCFGNLPANIRFLCDDETIKKSLDSEATNVLFLLNNRSLAEKAGDFNYIVSAIAWGMLGDYDLYDVAQYATRAYMHSILMRMKDKVDRHFLYGPSPENLMAASLLRGVIGDIKKELYRRRTSQYEDQKIDLNGDIYPLE